MSVILIFKCTEGTGVGDYSSRGRWARIFLASSQTAPCPLSSFDTHARWQPETQSARSRRSYGRIEDCEQSRAMVLPESFQNLKCFKAQEKGKVLDTFG